MNMEQAQALALEALKRYRVQPEAIASAGASASRVWKVTDASGNSYSLRQHQSASETLERQWTRPEVITSEMMWLSALKEQSDIVAPIPVPNLQGAFVTELEGTCYSMLQWVEGEQKPFIATYEDVQMLGALIGKLHRHSSNWTKPRQFTRPGSDANRIDAALTALKTWVISGKLPEEAYRTLTAAGDRAIGMMERMNRSSETWGLIHGDLIPVNVLFHENQCRPIDFGACSFGYYVYDIGWTFSYIHPSLRPPLLEAYSGYFALPDNHERLLEACMIGAQLGTLHFWLGLPESEVWLPEHLDKLASREALSFIEGRAFIFEGQPYWE